MDLLTEIMKTAPKHKEVKVPFMTLGGLKNEAKKRLGGIKWGKVGVAGRRVCVSAHLFFYGGC